MQQQLVFRGSSEFVVTEACTDVLDHGISSARIVYAAEPNCGVIVLTAENEEDLRHGCGYLKNHLVYSEHFTA
ncbi:MAG: hypothetical protein WA021_04400 [Minisyncoccia bacterium]